jgi:hypothetical protein
VWHASVSLQTRKGRIDDESYVERAAIDALAGVGGDHEWWCWVRLVGHLRVPVTAEENALIPPGCVTTDAGETGPQRPRSR